MPPILIPSNVYRPKLLTQIGARYKPVGFIADELMPIVPVGEEQGYYAKYNKGAWFRDEVGAHGPIAPGETGVRINFNIDLTNNYQAHEYEAIFALPRRTAKAADAGLDIRAYGAELATCGLMLAKERRVAAIIFQASNWGTGTDPTISTTWDNYDTSDPIGEIDTGRIAVRENTGGLIANVCAMGPQVWDQLRRHPEILELVFGSGSNRMIVPSLADFGRAFDFEKVLVGHAMYTADEERTTETATNPSLSYVWGKNMWIGHVSPANNMFQPSAGYQMRVEFGVTSYRDASGKNEFIAANEIQAEEEVAVDCGYYIPSCVA